MELGGYEVNCGELIVSHPDAGRVVIAVELCPDLESGSHHCRSAVTANEEVSWSVPTETQPSFCASS